jgi:RND family efflux transporter MFP subunit
MNKHLERIKGFVWPGKRKYVLIALLIILGGWFVMFRGGGDDAQNAGIFEVKKINLLQEVTVTGSVKPAQNVSLSFDTSGRVAGVYVNVGSRVGPGTLIASLSNGNLRADLEKAEATLSEIKKGARAEDIAVTESELVKAKQDLENYFNNTEDTLSSAFLKADDALNTQTNEIFSNANTPSPQITFIVSGFQDEVNAERTRVEAVTALNSFEKLLNTLPEGRDGRKQALDDARSHLEIISTHLSITYGAVNNAAGLNATTQATYKADITTARTNVNSSISSINTLRQSIASQEATVVRSENALALKKAGATPEELARAQADVTSAQSSLARTLIVSPIAGIVSKAEPKTGETVSGGAALFEVISAGKYEVEVNIPEVDVAKVVVGNTAKITLDAYGDDVVFPARVSKINPAESIIDGVPTYTTTLLFETDDVRIRSGMTANITIETAKKENVIAIPGRAVITKDGKKWVRIRDEQGVETEVEVTTGLRGSAGLVEVLTGVSEGQRVVTAPSAN